MNILVINAGSSSLKYQLLDPESGVLLAKGLCERIGIDGKFTYKAEGKKTLDAIDIPMPTHSEAIQAVPYYFLHERNWRGGTPGGPRRRGLQPVCAD